MNLESILINQIAFSPVIIALLVVIIIILVALAFSFKLVVQTKKIIVERLGGYHTTLGVGVHFIIPIVDRVVSVVSLKEQVIDFPPTSVITKDNVTVSINTVVFFSVTDPRAFTYGTRNPVLATQNISSTVLRNIAGSLELDELLSSRSIVNTRITKILDEATDIWGIKVHRVEIKDIIPTKSVREAMEKQMRAERERRHKVLAAQGRRRAEILAAEGDYQARVLRAEAQKKERIFLAEGEAKAIVAVKEAEALGIQLIKDADADQAVLTLKSLEALPKVAQGQDTNIVIPANIADIASTLASSSNNLQKKSKSAPKKQK